jgi:hypothetical protein
MLVDTDAIHTFGASCSAHAADLTAASTALTSLTGADAITALGPVGACFLAALEDAATTAAHAITALSADLGAAHSVSGAVADAYADADHRGSHLL